MVRITYFNAGLTFASVALSSLFETQVHGYNASTPCEQVSASVAAQSAATPTVAAELAYECIISVPLNQSVALALLDGVVPYFRWQGNMAFLKNPPEEYVEMIQPAVDICGGLETIRRKVVSGEYSNEYSNEYEVYGPHEFP